MATTTPNYGWDVPTSTDYVKDGATAIETLGDDIDASLFSITSGKNVGMVHINTTTFTGSSTINVNNVFSANFDNYHVELTLTQTTLSDINFRWRVAGADNSAAVYNFQTWRLLNTNVWSPATTFSQTSSPIGRLAANGIFSNSMEIFRPFATVYSSYETTNIRWDGAAAMQSEKFFGTHEANTSFTGFTIFGASMTGTIRIYGYRN